MLSHCFFATGVYINDVRAERRSNFSSYGFTSLFSNPAADLTVEAIYVMLVFILFFIGAMIGNLVNVKTTTSKVLAIIGLSFSLWIVLISFVVLSAPSHLTFDESGGFFLIYGVICLAFFIVFLVQSVKYQRMPVKKNNPQLLDDDIV